MIIEMDVLYNSLGVATWIEEGGKGGGGGGVDFATPSNHSFISSLVSARSLLFPGSAIMPPHRPHIHLAQLTSQVVQVEMLDAENEGRREEGMGARSTYMYTGQRCIASQQEHFYFQAEAEHSIPLSFARIAFKIMTENEVRVSPRRVLGVNIYGCILLLELHSQ